jgi:phosphatidylglycerophosphatase A
MARKRAPLLGEAAVLVATLGRIGFIPLAPGTFGSLAALPFAWLIVVAGGVPALLAGAALLFVVGWWAASRVARVAAGDPGFVVIDEAVGQWLTLAAAPLDPLFWAAGFLLFRLFDVAEPWPVRWSDARIGGGFGIMFDDVLAAIYAAIVLLLARYLFGR